MVKDHASDDQPTLLDGSGDEVTGVPDDQPSVDEAPTEEAAEAPIKEAAEAANDTTDAAINDGQNEEAGPEQRRGNRTHLAAAPRDDLAQQPRGPRTSSTMRSPVDRAVASALWAAWGDALGFITELVDANGVRRRLGLKGKTDPSHEGLVHTLAAPPDTWPLQHTVAWHRIVGGRGGGRAQLPAGTYSDDTQLRLATSRSLRDGRFDVDAWARVELPAFTSYALGGGKATKNGAAAMTQPSKHWAEGDRAWSNAGGNGVLMRIAPHAYASLGSDLPTELLLIDVIRNGVVTHGHPRALLPACVHAVLLAQSLRTGDLPDIDGVHQLLYELRDPHWIASDRELAQVFLPAWHQANKSSFEDAWSQTVNEMHELLALFGEPPADHATAAATYLERGSVAGLFDDATRGVGTATFVAAHWLSLAFADQPELGLRLSGNAVGTDTDTIATVAGAHLGVLHPHPEEHRVQDRAYIARETLRLVAPRSEEAAETMRYPALLQWRAPKAQADYFGVDPETGAPALAGLGIGEIKGQPFWDPKHEFCWQWMTLHFGQHVLVKRRAQPETLPYGSLPHHTRQPESAAKTTVEPSAELDELRQRAARRAEEDRRAAAESRRSSTAKKGRPSNSEAPASRDTRVTRSTPAPRPALTLNEALRRAESAGFDSLLVGELIKALAIQAPPGSAAAFAEQLTQMLRNNDA